MKQLVVHLEEELTQVAILEQDKLLNYIIEPVSDSSIVGNIYKAVVQNVLPGMQAAFVDIGTSKNAFIYIDDVLHPNQDKHPNPKPNISDVLKPGNQLIVQVIKDAQANKGARVTTHINLAGRSLVYLPIADYVGVSRKVTNETERERLKAIATQIVKKGEGVILRTVATDVTINTLEDEVQRLRLLWQNMVKHAAIETVPTLLYTEIKLYERIFRDFYTPDVSEVWVSSKVLQDHVKTVLTSITPTNVPEVRYYEQPANKVITYRGINEKVKHAFSRKVTLPSGGNIVWEETETLTVIDVNTGKYVGHTNLETTLLQINSEAAEMIATLLRVRDTGGIIIIDFIDMESQESKDHVYKLLQRFLEEEGSKCSLFGWTKLGLMELTRKKSRDSMTEKYLKQFQLM